MRYISTETFREIFASRLYQLDRFGDACPVPEKERFPNSGFFQNVSPPTFQNIRNQPWQAGRGVADNIIFSAAPLGIITAIVGAIREGGSKAFEAIIGRARESRSVVELELMSSTSTDV